MSSGGCRQAAHRTRYCAASTLQAENAQLHPTPQNSWIRSATRTHCDVKSTYRFLRNQSKHALLCPGTGCRRLLNQHRFRCGDGSSSARGAHSSSHALPRARWKCGERARRGSGHATTTGAGGFCTGLSLALLRSPEGLRSRLMAALKPYSGPVMNRVGSLLLLVL